MAKFCSSCGAALTPGAAACAACGAALTASAGPAAGPPPYTPPSYTPPVAAAPSALSMEYKIEGDNLQILRVKLRPGMEVYAEAGKMVYKTPSIHMESKMIGQSLGEKLLGALKRKVAGESLFTTHFTCPSGQGEIGFAGDYPGRLQAITISPGRAFLAQRDSFICAENSVAFSIAFQRKLGTGFFGGEGFILEKFTGSGTVFIHGGGDFVVFDLAPGEMLQVDTGCIVGFEETVDYDIQFAGGIKTALFGGEGLFLATLRGPGRAIIQTLTLAKLRRELGAMTGGNEQAGLGSIGKIFGSDD